MTAATLQQAAGPLVDLISDRVGVIRSVTPMQRGAEEPTPPFLYRSLASHFDFRMAKLQERMAVGKGFTEKQAILGAIGEAVERYCASHFDTRATRLATWDAVSRHAIAPTEFVLYSDAQHERGKRMVRKWNPEDEVTWLPIHELPGHRELLAPASLIYLQIPELRPQDAFTHTTSNGLAAGPDLPFAILHGLYECIERDAFLITWMARLPAPEIEFTPQATFAHAIRGHYARFGVEIRVFGMCTDIAAHVMMAVALDKTGSGPAALVGLGCHSSPVRAVERALLEICQLHPSEVRRYRDEPPQQRLKTPEDVRTLEDHSAWLTVPERLHEFSFLLDNGRRTPLADLRDYSTGSVPSDLDHCVASLKTAGCRVLYADLTTSDMTDYPIRVARAVATGLQPIHFGHGEERLGGTRLFELPRKLGFASHVLGESDLNPCPHPLA
jgi:ribosomal protein S12 methylthiotransferase accessory factor